MYNTLECELFTKVHALEDENAALKAQRAALRDRLADLERQIAIAQGRGCPDGVCRCEDHARYYPADGDCRQCVLEEGRAEGYQMGLAAQTK